MRTVDVIKKKRDGGKLTPDEMTCFIKGVNDRSWESYQISAMLMAIVCRGLDEEETAELTEQMVKSGTTLDWSGLCEAMVDKHSAGGVGDKTSLVLVPLAAACGCKIPKMSGRGLSHTGGTLDKLESIPGYRINLSPDEFRAAVQEVGCAIIGQTANLAPADKALYHLRDVTATVDNIPLIASSIMSKKIAEGIHGLVLDVKTGSGAFMKTVDEARALAQAMVKIGKYHKVKTICLLTEMNHPLGSAIGNTLEVIEAIDTLRGKGPQDLTELSIRLAAWLVVLAGQESEVDHAEERVREALISGKGLDKLREMVARQGGDTKVIDDPARFRRAEHRHSIRAKSSGYVTAVEAELLGKAAMLLGAGRERVEDVIDHTVGLMLYRKPGDRVVSGDVIVELSYNQGHCLAKAEEFIHQAYSYAPEAPGLRPLILETVM